MDGPKVYSPHMAPLECVCRPDINPHSHAPDLAGSCWCLHQQRTISYCVKLVRKQTLCEALVKSPLRVRHMLLAEEEEIMLLSIVQAWGERVTAPQ